MATSDDVFKKIEEAEKRAKESIGEEKKGAEILIDKARKKGEGIIYKAKEEGEKEAKILKEKKEREIELKISRVKGNFLEERKKIEEKGKKNLEKAVEFIVEKAKEEWLRK